MYAFMYLRDYFNHAVSDLLYRNEIRMYTSFIVSVSIPHTIELPMPFMSLVPSSN